MINKYFESTGDIFNIPEKLLTDNIIDEHININIEDSSLLYDIPEKFLTKYRIEKFFNHNINLQYNIGYGDEFSKMIQTFLS